MNKELLYKIADTFDKYPSLYDQNSFGPDDAPQNFPHCEWDSGRILLELNQFDATKLFYTSWLPPIGMTVPQALRHIADTGKVVDGFDQLGGI